MKNLFKVTFAVVALTVATACSEKKAEDAAAAVDTAAAAVTATVDSAAATVDSAAAAVTTAAEGAAEGAAHEEHK
jgi:hypothetical protein